VSRALPAALVILLAGCSGGVPLHPLSGTVTCDGKPIPAGVISLEPDPTRGGRGPATVVQIKDGQFATDSGDGVVGGPYVARVRGYDGQRDPKGELPYGRELFPETAVPIDLPQTRAAVDIVVPAPVRKP
jgi:hypothetical protein